MNALILAAGFGTRMGRLSAVTAKPLLPVAGKPVAEHLADNLVNSDKINSITVVTNSYYFEQFADWAAGYGRCEIKVLDDGAESNDTRLGSIADIRFAVENSGLRGPLPVLAGDNIFGFDIAEMIDFQSEKGTDIVAAYYQPDVERLRRTGVAGLDAERRVFRFEEKPALPCDTFAVPCLYILTDQTLRRIPEYLDSGNSPDAPGYFIDWLHTRATVHAFVFDAPLYSIGDAASYERTRRALENSE